MALFVRLYKAVLIMKTSTAEGRPKNGKQVEDNFRKMLINIPD